MSLKFFHCINLFQGESSQTVSVRTKPDEILEGEEHFNLSIVSVSNNADISPDRGYVTLVIQADPGAAGVVSVSQESLVMYTGEPTVESDGILTIVLNRGVRKYYYIFCNNNNNSRIYIAQN